MAGGKTVIITSTDAGGSTIVGINGKHRTLPHNQEVAVSDAEFEVLENAVRVNVEVVGNASKSDVSDAVDGPNATPGVDVGPGTPAGADSLPTAEPVVEVPIVLAPATDDTPAGADHLTPAPGPADVDAATEEARERVQAAEEGTQEPVVELSNLDPDQTGTDQTETTATGTNEGDGGPATDAGTLNREPFSAGTTLDQPITAIREDMDEFSPQQLRALLDAERSGRKRSTLIEALERKIASA